MNHFTSNHYLPLSQIERKVIQFRQTVNHTELKQIFEQPQKSCLKFLKGLWSDVNIEDHCKLASIDLNQVNKSEDILISETIDAQCQECLKTSKHKLSAYEHLFLSNYNLAMNDFEDGKIKESFSSYDHYR